MNRVYTGGSSWTLCVIPKRIGPFCFCLFCLLALPYFLLYPNPSFCAHVPGRCPSTPSPCPLWTLLPWRFPRGIWRTVLFTPTGGGNQFHPGVLVTPVFHVPLCMSCTGPCTRHCVLFWVNQVTRFWRKYRSTPPCLLRCPSSAEVYRVE